MKYTLYIDESGDFESQKGQWVLSGVLLSGSYEECEKNLDQIFAGMPSELSLKSIKNFHLTEFRREHGHKEATVMAQKTLARLKKSEFNYHFLATVNHSKTSLSMREKTYRLMLLDLLALCETVLPEDQSIENLDLIVATRTIDGQLQTTVSDLQSDVLKSLPAALEVDLATRGIVDLVGKHIKVTMDYANNSWGLVCADFIANLNYHSRKTPESEYLGNLVSQNKLTRFESFGDFASRRANVAERDKDYVLSTYRWLMILSENANNITAIESLNRLLSKLFNKRGTTGSKISFEALIERLWRQNNSPEKYAELKKTLVLFEAILIDYFILHQINGSIEYLFRLRNLLLIVENHLGNTNNGFEICKKQSGILSSLASNPEHFQMILDFKSIEIEVYINDLDFVKADELAGEYQNLIANFKDVWSLLVDEYNDKFAASRAAIKSSMIKLRTMLLNPNNFQNGDFNEHFDFESLESRLSNCHDLSRFSNYKTLLDIRHKRPKKALKIYLDKAEKNQLDVFELFWFMRAINDALLSSEILNVQRLSNVLEIQIQFIDLNKKGHPYDLILRELALYEFQTGNKSKALKYIRQSRNVFNLENSNIAIWIEELITIHEDFINGRLQNEKQYFQRLQHLKFIDHVFSHRENNLLLKVRYYSPY